MTSSTEHSGIPCPVCGSGVVIGSAAGRKSQKPFVSLTCPVTGNHFRAFIGDPDYVARVRARLANDHD